jgi:hypothetical protein
MSVKEDSVNLKEGRGTAWRGGRHNEEEMTVVEGGGEEEGRGEGDEAGLRHVEEGGEGGDDGEGGGRAATFRCTHQMKVDSSTILSDFCCCCGRG